MDSRPVVGPPVRSSENVVHADQAIFTSQRGLMGEGYRLIAASSALSAGERTEITRRCPSHHSLCLDSPNAVGLSSYGLESGRHCLGYCRYAGTEQSGRGGQRVHTHLAVLDGAAYGRFEGNPVRAVMALARAVGDPPILKAPPRLEPLVLSLDARPVGGQGPLRGDLGTGHDADWLVLLMASILTGRNVIVVGAARPFETLEWTMNAVPLSLRKTVSATVGLKWSPARQIQLSLVDYADRDTVRALHGRDIDRLDVTGVPPRPPVQAVTPYLTLIRRWWNEGRFVDIARLGSLLNGVIRAEDLAGAAGLCNDIDAIKSAEPAVLDGLIIKYTRFRPGTDAEVSLVEQFRQQARERKEALCRSTPIPE